MKTIVEAWKCEKCGYVWYKSDQTEPPTRCAGVKKCRKWHTSNERGLTEDEQASAKQTVADLTKSPESTPTEPPQLQDEARPPVTESKPNVLLPVKSTLRAAGVTPLAKPSQQKNKKLTKMVRNVPSSAVLFVPTVLFVPDDQPFIEDLTYTSDKDEQQDEYMDSV